MKINIIDYGAGNVFSVIASLERLGVKGTLSRNWEEIQSADRVIFPGVGHAGPAMAQLKATQLDQLIPSLRQPVLGICLGMQLMCEFSEEGNTPGMGIFPGVKICRFSEEMKVPHMGWNDLQETKGTLKSLAGPMYFVHSYYAPISQWTVAQTLYPTPFSAALEKDNFLGCQFHPEKSGIEGEKLLKRFLQLPS